MMIGNDWDEKLDIVWKSEGFQKFWKLIQNEYESKTIYPTFDNIFNALKLTPYKDVKVVIVGQDPYHEEGQANGLAFSVSSGVDIPPSLKNIFKLLKNDLGIDPPESGDLTSWAKQGVLLLNSALTVVKGQANSHQKIGWNLLTDYIIKLVSLKDTPVVFILWGNFAKNKKNLIDTHKHYIIENVHPSPLSANEDFYSSKAFSKANEYLEESNEKAIDWSL